MVVRVMIAKVSLRRHVSVVVLRKLLLIHSS